jgi:hypothetical protein
VNGHPVNPRLLEDVGVFGVGFSRSAIRARSGKEAARILRIT